MAVHTKKARSGAFGKNPFSRVHFRSATPVGKDKKSMRPNVYVLYGLAWAFGFWANKHGKPFYLVFIIVGVMIVLDVLIKKLLPKLNRLWKRNIKII
jgi:hypothetical protein